MNSASGRDALLQATIKVVARAGLRQLTNRAVAAEAGVSHGLVRHHFGTRDQLIAEALEYAVEESLRVTSMLYSAPRRRGDIAKFAAGIESVAEQQADMQAFQYELLLESRRRPELRQAVERYYETYRKSTCDRLREFGIDDEDLADVIWLAFEGLVFRQLVLGGDASRTLARIRRLVVDNTTK